MRNLLELREKRLSDELIVHSDRHLLDCIENAGHVPGRFNRGHLEVMVVLRGELIKTQKARDRLDLYGMNGPDRAARNYSYPPRPLLVMYLRELYRAWTGRYPADENSKFSDACNCVWEFATYEKTDGGGSWLRQIRSVKRKLEIKSDSPWFVLSGDGPDTGFTHFCALQSADALGIQFVEELRRKDITTPRTAEAEFRSAFIHEAFSRLNDRVR